MRAVYNQKATRRPSFRHSSGGGIPLHCLAAGLGLCLLAAGLLLPGQAAGQEIPYSAVFTESTSVTRSPFRDQRWSADPQLQFGQGASLRTSRLQLGLDTDLGLPLKEGPAPEDAMLRLWRIYANMPRTSVEFIASDNADRTTHNRKGGVIGMVSTDFDILLQLTDNLQIVSRGSLIYLPFENEVGLHGFGLLDDRFGLAGEIDASSDLFIEAKLDGVVGEWDFFVADRIGLEPDANSDLRSYRTADARLNYLRANNFDKADTLGRYSLGGRGRINTQGDDLDSNSTSDDRWGYSTAYYYNKASTGVSRTIPTETLVGLTAYRTDRWGMDGRGRGERDSEWEHGVNLSLVNQHYNMRFKPYFTYTASTNSEDHFWQHVARLGVTGPLSEYTDLNANVGYAWRSGYDRKSDDDSRSWLWHVSLHNELNELTTHRLSYSRYIQPDSNRYHTTLAYSLHRVLGPYLDSSLFAVRTEVDGGENHLKDDETRYEVGARLGWDVSSRLDLTLTGTMSVVRRHNQDTDYKESRIRLAADYDLSDTVELMLSYEYARRTDDVPDRDYYENLVRLRLTKRW